MSDKEKGNELEEFVKFQINRKVINLYKNFFVILEDLQENGFLKVSSGSYNRIRKKILDGGNDCIREIEEYLEKIKEKEKIQKNELLRIQTGEYRKYVAELVKLGDIMTKKFYIVVPYHPLADAKKGIFSRVMEIVRPVDTLRVTADRFKERRREIMKRIDHVQASLNSMGVLSIALDTQGLIELYYNTYNPSVAESQPLIDISKLDIEEVI